MENKERSETIGKAEHQFVFKDFNLADLTSTHILQNSAELPTTDRRGFFDLHPDTIDVDYASLKIPASLTESIKVVVRQQENSVSLHCACSQPKKKLCEHQIQVLYNVLHRKDLRVFFDKKLRAEKIRVVAADYGLENESDPDEYFFVEYQNKEISIKPKMKELLPVSAASVMQLESQLIPSQSLPRPVGNGMDAAAQADPEKRALVLGQNKYYDHFYLELYEITTTRDGKLKNPLTLLNPLDEVWQQSDPEVVKFYTAVAAFQGGFRKKHPENDLQGLKSIVKNPLNLAFYYHDPAVSENVNAGALVAAKLERTPAELHLLVDHQPPFYQISGQLLIDVRTLDLEKVTLRYDYFVQYGDVFYLIDSLAVLQVIAFFRQHNQKIYIHESKFEEFRTNIISKVDKRIRITYAYLKPATEKQLAEQGFDREIEKIIYLEESGNYVAITPVVKYGSVEVPAFSRDQIYAVDSHGHPFTVARDTELELRFAGMLMRQHPDFEEQLGRDAFYLHRESFLSENWFPDAFASWQDQQISILGFNKISKNRLNQHKASISVHVVSGINWFNTTANVHFGKQKVTLKHLHQAVKNKTKYIPLDDGTLGILPAEWIEKFTKFFEAGEISGEVIKTAKINFAGISELYDAALLANDVKDQLSFYRSRFANFDSIEPVQVPESLHVTLRDYQKQGLNWLNFLDDFGFGGCLADDMGLGKTLQIIAFILSQRAKQAHNTNLIVVPTSLLFNWQAEVEKFAPSIRMFTLYGTSRVRDISEFDAYEIILTSYGTLLADLNLLKKYRFNYVILDESQAIKNPESQRYKAARLLQSRNKLVLTGTPIENNTFDLYGQLSFACPGLLGNKVQFRNHFSIPIDRFQDAERARELQKRISPFILRRTKKQVATELPDKTEVILYCQMGEAQRQVYNAYELEFYTFLNTRNEVDIPRESLHILQGLTKLRQICDSPALLNDHQYYGSASSKIDVLLEQIESKSPEHKILVFSQFVSMLDLIRAQLRDRGIAFEYLTGQTKDREARVQSFQNDSRIRVFLISLKAGGTGLNLTEADYVYLVDPWWNPAVENQAIDRSYRIGQKKNVIAVRLICPGTIEEKIMELQETKKDLADDLVKTDTSVLKSLTRQDLLALVSNNFTSGLY